MLYFAQFTKFMNISHLKKISNFTVYVKLEQIIIRAETIKPNTRILLVNEVTG